MSSRWSKLSGKGFLTLWTWKLWKEKTHVWTTLERIGALKTAGKLTGDCWSAHFMKVNIFISAFKNETVEKVDNKRYQIGNSLISLKCETIHRFIVKKRQQRSWVCFAVLFAQLIIWFQKRLGSHWSVYYDNDILQLSIKCLKLLAPSEHIIHIDDISDIPLL